MLCSGYVLDVGRIQRLHHLDAEARIVYIHGATVTEIGRLLHGRAKIGSIRFSTMHRLIVGFAVLCAGAAFAQDYRQCEPMRQERSRFSAQIWNSGNAAAKAAYWEMCLSQIDRHEGQEVFRRQMYECETRLRNDPKAREKAALKVGEAMKPLAKSLIRIVDEMAKIGCAP